MSKKKQQQAHCVRRFAERYSIRITQNDFAIMVRQIQGGTAKLLEKQTNRISIWEIELRGENYPVVYDRDRKTVVTVLKRDWFKDGVRMDKFEVICDA